MRNLHLKNLVLIIFALVLSTFANATNSAGPIYSADMTSPMLAGLNEFSDYSLNNESVQLDDGSSRTVYVLHFRASLEFAPNANSFQVLATAENSHQINLQILERLITFPNYGPVGDPARIPKNYEIAIPINDFIFFEDGQVFLVDASVKLLGNKLGSEIKLK